MRIGAIVLAAGLARRMGRSKLDLQLNGKPVLAHVLHAVGEAELPFLVVTGAHAEVTRRIAGDALLVDAADHLEGLGASLRSGVMAVPGDWDGLLVVLGDMPFVQPATFRALAGALASGAEAVVPVQDGRWGNPAGFSRAHFAALAKLGGDSGARVLLRRIGATELAVEDEGIHRDIDVAADLPGAELQ